MGTSKYLVLLLLLTACHNKEKNKITVKTDSTTSTTEVKTQKTPFVPYMLKAGYQVTDTGYYNITIGDGVYAIIKKDNKLVDTIDLSYGIQQVKDDQYLYYTIKGRGSANKEDANSNYKNSIMASLGDYTLITNEKKDYLKNIAPDFDSYFSSPAAINGAVYYWQIKRKDSSGNVSVSAAEYNPSTKQTVNYYIGPDILDTDDSGYFPLPYIKDDTIYFDAGKNKVKKFSKDFKAYN